MSDTKSYIPTLGDLLFQEGYSGDFEEAIRTVTPSYQGHQFSHVGTLCFLNGEPMVIEAISKGVVYTELNSFLQRDCDANGRPRVMVLRLKQHLVHVIPHAIKHMHQLVGKPYNSTFNLNNDEYYCSEIIYKCFLQPDGKPIFSLYPMTFKHPQSGETFEKWEAYFENLKAPIPEGELGLNPGGLANEEVLELAYSFFEV